MDRPLLPAAIAALVLVGAAMVGLGGPARANATSCSVHTLTAGSRWVGSYTCGQGLTELSLIVGAVRGTTVDAVFDFNWRAGGVANRFAMRGTIEPRTCRLRLEPVRWIDQPPQGWVMVGLDGTLDKSGRRYSGRVRAGPRGHACTTFSVTLRR